MGGSLTYLNQGEQQATGLNQEDKGTFNAYQFALTLTYGTKVSDHVGTGLSVKYFRDQLAPEEVLEPGQKGSGQTWAVDVGTHIRGTAFSEALDRLNLGVSLSNLGPDITFDDEAQADPMPLTLRLGGAYEPYRSSFQSFTVVSDYLISLVEGRSHQGFGRGSGVGLQQLPLRARWLQARSRRGHQGCDLGLRCRHGQFHRHLVAARLCQRASGRRSG